MFNRRCSDVEHLVSEKFFKTIFYLPSKLAAVMNNRSNDSTPTGEKRKRGRPRIDKTSPEYIARKRAREKEAQERKEKKEYRRRTTGAKTVKTKISTKVTRTKIPITVKKPTGQRIRKLPTKLQGKLPVKMQGKLPTKMPGKLPAKNAKLRKVTKVVGDKKILVRRNTKFIRRKDSAASSSAGDTTPRVKRKYTKRAPGTKKTDSTTGEKVKGKRGRPRKVDQMAANNKQLQQPKIRVRSNLMPTNNETITLDSDDEPDLGSPSQASDLSFDENLRALRHIHEKYANIDKDDLYEAHLLAANFKKPPTDQRHRDDDEVLSVRSSEGKLYYDRASFARADQLAQHLNSHLANYKRLKP
ncbi:uncharacterized protein LOC113240216 [Hyposmocoma kahamanoa]|uniref:uncharacterized protein LOC113240216 n=1 Tax=Hyposmocoma kahamanoa TaxID=1477025 RepID=UPI000E6D63FB|nr:uncharacterized protein LOC113240216 [Hyposmocoma kahamanoa]